jgi:predicted anti-sigma-YlaC factor YlaD
MKCEKAKEILLTHYIDNCISINLRKKLYAHLENCPACRGYKLDIDKVFPFLFREANVESPRKEMWENIESAILRKGVPAENRVFDIRPFLKKSVFAFATAAVLLITVISFKVVDYNRRIDVNNFLAKEGYFLYSLKNNDTDEMFNDTYFSTGIEEYFL